jgi:hypothetical protein
MNTPAKKPNRNRINLYLDIALFAAFLLADAPQGTGIPVHEWLSVALIAALIVHLLLHWTWIVNTIKRFTANGMGRNRANFVLNTLLFIDVVVIMFSGFMISRAVLPALGISLPAGFAWRRLHDASATAGILLLALHVAIHWRWIVSMFSKYVLRRPTANTAVRTQEAGS